MISVTVYRPFWSYSGSNGLGTAASGGSTGFVTAAGGGSRGFVAAGGGSSGFVIVAGGGSSGFVIVAGAGSGFVTVVVTTGLGTTGLVIVAGAGAGSVTVVVTTGFVIVAGGISGGVVLVAGVRGPPLGVMVAVDAPPGAVGRSAITVLTGCEISSDGVVSLCVVTFTVVRIAIDKPNAVTRMTTASINALRLRLGGTESVSTPHCGSSQDGE